ncbi:hypothetical protein PG993_003523 [Apiospora rasikravindrae]|uniref:Uncharacterized protein n=1 Tax=Apiospora rasikravindrae TaxID=990691 RepID=A0ABR1TZS3_9PEZI
MSAVLKTFAETETLKEVRQGKEGLEENYCKYVEQTDVIELMYYLTSIIVWMVANRDLYERLGYEKVHWKAKLWRSIWRYHTSAALYETSNRSPREVEALYGEHAQGERKDSMNKIYDHIETIISVRAQIREKEKENLPPSRSKSQTDTNQEEEPESLTPGKRASTSKKEVLDITASDDADDESPGTPSRTQRPPLIVNSDSGSNKPEPEEPDQTDAFEELDEESKEQYNEWKQVMENAAPGLLDNTVIDPDQLKWLLQRKGKDDEKIPGTGRAFWPAPIGNKKDGYEL